ncbi:hypothetical protein MAPG_06151 [Magnaporthiopsis poae ATCC 64411]|uniref:Glucose-methanol-choline oxidoreductase N-terminal domain-containing protein n=1 Tax=Magnaporthiopsis poae (strain ATCC 64411 / 73-15) TaxID=644358 RepID=A0A0C4E197_MAGP6|nr:hypothetical protein MAPG_06151 [Magnaporthiopsis poae ATCC 64411]
MVRFFGPVAVLTTLLGSGGTFAEQDKVTYDYIIVGGGTAGVALATRLSQGLPSASILLLEAGPANLVDDTITIPGFGGRSWSGPFDWNLSTVAQTHLGGRKIPLPRGKVLGGSSALNLMVWDHGSRREYDAWEELGNPGWNWRSMYAAMLRAHNFTRFPGTYGNEGVGAGGPVQTVISPSQPEYMRRFFIETFNAVGPLSVGNVHIQPGEPPSRPAIDCGYLSAAYDVAAVIEAGKWMRRMGETQPLKSGLVLEYEPGLDLLGPNATDAEWEAWVRRSMATLFHPSGTCALLPRRDGGVVDPALRVYGTANLRVVDASVMPLLVSGHIQSAVYGIAERAAEFIIGDSGKQGSI